MSVWSDLRSQRRTLVLCLYWDISWNPERSDMRRARGDGFLSRYLHAEEDRRLEQYNGRDSFFQGSAPLVSCWCRKLPILCRPWWIYCIVTDVFQMEWDLERGWTSTCNAFWMLLRLKTCCALLALLVVVVAMHLTVALHHLLGNTSNTPSVWKCVYAQCVWSHSCNWHCTVFATMGYVRRTSSGRWLCFGRCLQPSENLLVSKRLCMNWSSRHPYFSHMNDLPVVYRDKHGDTHWWDSWKVLSIPTARDPCTLSRMSRSFSADTAPMQLNVLWVQALHNKVWLMLM